MIGRLREGCIDDAAAMTSLDRLCFPPDVAFPYRLFRQLLASKSTISLLAEGDSGFLQGFLIAEYSDSDSMIWTVDVHENHRSQGIGSMLFSELFKRLAEKGVEKIFLQVYTENASALAFYKKHGFVKLELVHNYYGKNKDAWSMVRYFTNNPTKSSPWSSDK